MVKKTKKITTSSSIKRIFYPFIEAEQITCRSMNTLWLCCDCNARCFSHCRNLPKDQTTEDHTLDQRLGAQWIYQSAKSSFLLIHSSTLSLLMTQKAFPDAQLTLEWALDSKQNNIVASNWGYQGLASNRTWKISIFNPLTPMSNQDRICLTISKQY